MRVVPNLYPAFERQEVVVHTPRHARSLAELDDERARASSPRRGGGGAKPCRTGYLHALVNEGREAGLEPAAHALAARLAAGAAARDAASRRPGTLDRSSRSATASCSPAPTRAACRTSSCIAPAEPRADAFADELLPAALQLLGDAIRRVHRAAGAAPLNAWLHDSADWHFELLPRLSILAGVELGAGWWINAARARGRRGCSAG